MRTAVTHHKSLPHVLVWAGVYGQWWGKIRWRGQHIGLEGVGEAGCAVHSLGGRGGEDRMVMMGRSKIEGTVR